MYKNRKERSVEEDLKFPRSRRTPSFSSSLLDAIYRSIDESKVEGEDLGYIRQTDFPKKKQSNSYGSKLDSCFKEETKRTNLRQAIMIDTWIQKQSGPSSSLFFNSASSSSESSSGAAWSSSETESSCKKRSKPKQLRTGDSVHTQNYIHFEDRNLEKKQKEKCDNGISLTKTKLKALKIYGELKKVKQPISPGGRIATFIHSIFNSGNVKKAKMCYVGAVEDVSSDHVTRSACSSASTFSRSCLSKPTSSTRSKQSNGVKRSVRFYPVSVILGESSQPCVNKCVYEEDPSLMPIPTTKNFVRNTSLKKDHNFVMEKGNDVFERAARDIVGSYCNKELADDEDEDDEEDDVESYSSSDLFELDHLVGTGRYREELPVYETTNMKTNQAIANGFIL